MIELIDIHRHPIKGFPAEALEQATLTTGEGLPMDRHFAFVSGMREDVPEPGRWVHSRTFLILTDYPELATFKCQLKDDNQTLVVSNSNSEPVTAIAGHSDTFAAANLLLASHFGDGPHGTPRLVEQKHGCGNWDFADTPISIINLATLRQISKAADRPLERERFRGNLYIDGLEPWEEFSWPGSRIKVGGAELNVLRPIKRCAMTSTEPGTGRREVDVPAAMVDSFGHHFCGVYCQVVASGDIARSDSIEIITEASVDPFSGLPELAPSPSLWPQFATTRRVSEKRLEIRPTHVLPAKSGQRLRIHALSPSQSNHRQEIIGIEGDGWQINDIPDLPERVLISGPFGRN